MSDAASVSQIIKYEQGDLSDEETVALFQALVNSGLAWKLQGHYGRTAQAMLDAGVISSPFQVVVDYASTCTAETPCPQRAREGGLSCGH